MLRSRSRHAAVPSSRGQLVDCKFDFVDYGQSIPSASLRPGAVFSSSPVNLNKAAIARGRAGGCERSAVCPTDVYPVTRTGSPFIVTSFIGPNMQLRARTNHHRTLHKSQCHPDSDEIGGLKTSKHESIAYSIQQDKSPVSPPRKNGRARQGTSSHSSKESETFRQPAGALCRARTRRSSGTFRSTGGRCARP